MQLAESGIHSRLTHFQEEVDLVCASPGFRRSAVLTKLLRYLAAEVMAGRGAELNQYLIATEGLGMGEDFDPAFNSLVRVQGGRLRSLLRAYEAGPGKTRPYRLRLPERSFCLSFEPAPPSQPGERTPGRPPSVAVLEFGSRDLPPAWTCFPQNFTENLLEALAALGCIETFGPIDRRRADPDAAAAVEAGRTLGVSFLLEGSIHALPTGGQMHVRLHDCSTGRICWTTVFELPQEEKRLYRAGRQLADRLAHFVGDDFGAVRREILKSILDCPAEQLASHEAILLVWHAYSTMALADIRKARRAMKRTLQENRNNPLIQAFTAMNLIHLWSTAEELDPPFPEEALRLAAAAYQRDPGNPWVAMMHIYSCLLQGDRLRAEDLTRELEQRDISTLLRILLVNLRLRMQFGSPENAILDWNRLLREQAPAPPKFAHIAPAVYALHRQQWKEMKRHLQRADLWQWPFFPLFLAAAEAGDGNPEAARRHLSELSTRFPQFHALGENILNRLFAPEVWQALRDQVMPLAPELFLKPAASGVH